MTAALPGQALLRRASAAEAPQLSALALRSKARWGYDAAFLAACVEPLRLSPARLEAAPFVVLELDGLVVGFYGLAIDEDEAELTNLFVEPHAIGRGFEEQLWEHAVHTARELGCRRLRVVADPFAEPFYRAMGARRVGEVPSEAVPGRRLPLLSYALDERPRA
jgi:N-acetylglutamate synthase-like GNAT family acetyltransferase